MHIYPRSNNFTTQPCNVPAVARVGDWVCKVEGMALEGLKWPRLSCFFAVTPPNKKGEIWTLSRTTAMALATLYLYLCKNITGWPFSLFKTSCWYWFESCVLVKCPYTKTQLSNQCQWEVFNKLNGHPVYMRAFNSLLQFLCLWHLSSISANLLQSSAVSNAFTVKSLPGASYLYIPVMDSAASSNKLMGGRGRDASQVEN